MQVSSINSINDAKRLLASTSPDATGSDPAARAAASRNQASVAAKQFEAIILRQLLSPAIEPLMSGGITAGKGAMSGGGGGMYGYLVTDVMANSLSQGQGLGLSRILEKQLTPKSAALPSQAAASYRAGSTKNHE